MDKRIKGYLHVALALALLILLFYSTQVEGSFWKQIHSSDASAASPAAGDIFWSNPETLKADFDRYGADLGAASPDEYAGMAHAFYLAREKHLVKTSDGMVLVYDGESNMFGAYRESDGATEQFFKPEDGQAYFDRQPGN